MAIPRRLAVSGASAAAGSAGPLGAALASLVADGQPSEALALWVAASARGADGSGGSIGEEETDLFQPFFASMPASTSNALGVSAARFAHSPLRLTHSRKTSTAFM